MLNPLPARVARRHRKAFVVKSIAALLRYLQKEDWEKVFEVVQERDRDGSPEQFGEWIAEHYGPGGHGKSSDPAVQQVLDDPDQIMSLYPEDFSKDTYQDYFRLGEWEDPSWYQRDHEAPSWFNLTNPKLFKNQWVLHYTNDAEQIAQQGFKYGADDLSRLGGRVSNALQEQRSSGNFNFGYNTSNPSQYEAGHGKYGREAVLLKASGVEAWHSGDGEQQVIFAGNTAKDILPITSSNYGSGWLVGGLGKGGRPDGEGDAFPTLIKAVEWAKKNHAQYKNVMASPKRVAARYRQAAILTAPPAMVDAARYYFITRWGAGVLAEVKKKERSQKARIRKIQKMLQEQKASIAAAEKALKTGKPFDLLVYHAPKSGDFNNIRKRKLRYTPGEQTTDWRGEAAFQWEVDKPFEVHYLEFRNEAPYLESLKEYDEVGPVYLGHVIEAVERTLQGLTDFAQSVKQETAKRKSHANLLSAPNRDRTECEMDLSGWTLWERRIPDAAEREIREEALNAKKTLQMRFDAQDTGEADGGFSAYWSPSKWMVVFAGLSGYWSVKELLGRQGEVSTYQFKKSLVELDRVVNHEMAHYAQSVLKELLDLPEIAGHPGLSDPAYANIHGTPAGKEWATWDAQEQRWVDQRIPHELRDVEFEARLGDEIDRFERGLKRVDETLERDASKGNRDPYYAAEMLKDYFDMFTSRSQKRLDVWGADPSPWFAYLRKNDSKRYRAAVAKFTAEMDRRGFMKRLKTKTRLPVVVPNHKAWGKSISRMMPWRDGYEAEKKALQDYARFIDGLSLDQLRRHRTLVRDTGDKEYWLTPRWQDHLKEPLGKEEMEERRTEGARIEHPDIRRKGKSARRVAAQHIEAGLLKPPPGLAYLLGAGPKQVIGGYLREKYPDDRSFQKYTFVKGNKATVSFDLDRRGLAGWSYLRRAKVSPAEFLAQVLLEKPALAKLQVTIDFKGRGSAGGYYAEGKRTAIIYVNAETPAMSPWKAPTDQEVDKWVEAVKDTLQHELLHYTQALLSVLAGTKAGLPSPKIRTPDDGPHAELEKMDHLTNEAEIQHALRDAEFYTRLKDEVRIFNRKSFPHYAAWERARKLWVAGTDKETMGVLGRRSRFFFRVLKERAPRKWQKAVKEFMSATESMAPDAPKTPITLPSGGTSSHSYTGTDRQLRRMLGDPKRQLRAEVQAFQDRVKQGKTEYEAALTKLEEQNRKGKERGRPPRDLGELDYQNPALQLDAARKRWVGGPDREDLPPALGDAFVFPSSFFKALKQYAPDQYEPLAKEFLRATKGNPSRVAARYITAASLSVEEYYGKAGRKDHLTRYEKGTIPTKDALKIEPPRRYHGKRKWHTKGGERYFGNYTEEDWNEFLEDIRKNGIKTPLWIQKDPGEDAALMEGNHRVQAADQLGIREVPVYIRYYGLSEEDGLAAPSVRRTIKHHDPERVKTAARRVAHRYLHAGMTLFHLSPEKFSRFSQQSLGSGYNADLGFHFGTKDTALTASGLLAGKGRIKKGDTVYLYELDIDAGKPLVLDENRRGSWSIHDLIRSIFEGGPGGEPLPFITDAEFDDYYGQDEDGNETERGEGVFTRSGANLKELDNADQQRREFLSWLKAHGFNSVRYKNTYEGGGNSYIVFDPNQIKIKSATPYTYDG